MAAAEEGEAAGVSVLPRGPRAAHTGGRSEPVASEGLFFEPLDPTLIRCPPSGSVKTQP